MKQQKEHNLSVMISQYMQLKHKNIIFRFDIADLKLQALTAENFFMC